jgi:hypothetical protein
MSPDDLITPPAKSDSVEAVDPEELAFAIQLFQAGLRLVMPMESPQKRGIELGDSEMAQGFFDSLPESVRNQFTVKDSRLSPKDNPVNRGVFGVMKHYDKHPQRTAITARVMGFYHLVNSAPREILAEWEKPCKEDAEAVMLHPAVMDAAAVCPTIYQSVFEVVPFFELVNKIAAEKYSDE